VAADPTASELVAAWTSVDSIGAQVNDARAALNEIIAFDFSTIFVLLLSL
jgi:hypothetical protein